MRVIGDSLKVALVFLALAVYANICLAAEGEDQAKTFYKNADLGISFTYPSELGEVVLHDYRTDESSKRYLLKGAGMDWVLEFASPPKPYRLVLRVLDLSSRPHMRVTCYESDCDSSSLVIAETEIRRSADQFVGGCRAQVRDHYFEPGGSFQRKTFWFGNNRFFELTESIWRHGLENRPVGKGRDYGIGALLADYPNDERLRSFDLTGRNLLDSIQLLEH